MHVVGKILIFLVLAGTITVFILAGRLVNARGKWMKELQDARIQNDDSADKLAAARAARNEARDELLREKLRWERYWSGINGQFIANNETIVSALGGQLGVAPNAALYAFQLAADGTPTYVGAFSAAQVQPAQSALKASFRVRSDDVPKWNGQSWRFRTMIPASFAGRIGDLEGELVMRDELIAKQQKNLDDQNQLLEAAKQQRIERTAELLGDPKDPASPGLVAEIARAEDQRNRSLADVDTLRRQIRTTLAHAEELIRQNGELARSLPGQPNLAASAAPVGR